MSRPKEFTKSRLLLVEGKDEVNFFDKLLDNIGLKSSVEIRDFEGKDNLKNFLPAIKKASGFDNIVEKIAITRDADENAGDAFKSIIGSLKKAGISPPERRGEFTADKPSVGIFLLPDNSSGGMLEDLCLGAVQNNEAMECVDRFIACVQDLKNCPKNLSKARVQAYLAAQEEDVKSLGLGAKKGYWDLTSDALAPLIDFLHQLN